MNASGRHVQVLHSVKLTLPVAAARSMIFTQL
jgi:hypothetical protein